MTKLSLFAAVATAAIASAASADLIVGWTIPTAVPAGTTGVTYNYGAADQGAGAGSGMLSSSHIAAATAYSSPSGNGSQYAFSSNNWAIGDYYQFSFSTIGSEGLTVSWDQTRSSTGPSAWHAQYSIDSGANWSFLGDYTVIQAGLAGSGTLSWSATGAYQAAFTTTYTLGGDADNQASVMVRMISDATTAASGTSRIDNVMVGNNVPTPGAVALLGLAGLVARRRR